MRKTKHVAKYGYIPSNWQDYSKGYAIAEKLEKSYVYQKDRLAADEIQLKSIVYRRGLNSSFDKSWQPIDHLVNATKIRNRFDPSEEASEITQSRPHKRYRFS